MQASSIDGGGGEASLSCYALLSEAVMRGGSEGGLGIAENGVEKGCPSLAYVVELGLGGWRGGPYGCLLLRIQRKKKSG